jgi:hypothetical protein
MTLGPLDCAIFPRSDCRRQRSIGQDFLLIKKQRRSMINSLNGMEQNLFASIGVK